MDFEDMDVWKRSAALSAELYVSLKSLRDWSFRDQVTRSGLSVPSNIAEGLSRHTRKDRYRFLSIAKGSCAELRTQLYIGIKAGYIDKAKGAVWVAESKEIAVMLGGLMKTFDR